MPRNRIISPSMALFVSSGAAQTGHAITGGLLRLNRLTSLDYSFENPKENVTVYGKTASLLRDTAAPPTVSLSFSYYLLGKLNESNLGFDTNGTTPALASIISRVKDEKNYFVYIAPEGDDADGKTAGPTGNVVGIGNAYISSYSFEAAVGAFPTASVQVQGLNLRSYSATTSQPIPAVDPTTGLNITGVGNTFSIPAIAAPAGSGVAVIRPGDISVSLANIVGLVNDIPSAAVQSVSMNFDLNLEGQQALGSRFDRVKNMTFPIDVTLQVEVLAGDFINSNLADFLCTTGGYTASVNMRLPNCSGLGTVGAGFTLRNLSLESQNWSTTAGSASQTMSLSFLTQIGASGDTSNGLFISGLDL